MNRFDVLEATVAETADPDGPGEDRLKAGLLWMTSSCGDVLLPVDAASSRSR